jgi:hypothetical protein
MARKRQAAAEEKVAKGRAQKELDDIYKMTSIDPKGYLPFRLPEIKEKFAQGVSKMVEAIAAQDYNALQEAKNEIVMTSGNFAAEKKDVDEVIKGTEGGKLFSTADFRRLYSGAGMEDFNDMLESGAIQIHEQTGRIVPTTSQNIDINKEQINTIAKYKNKPTGNLNSLGQQIFELDVDAAKSALYDQYMLQPAIQAKFNALNGDRIPREGKSPEQIQAELANLYVTEGLRKALPNTTRNMPKGMTINIDNVPPEQEYSVTSIPENEINISVINPSGTTVLRRYGMRNQQAPGDMNITMPTNASAVNISTGQEVNTSDIKKGTFNVIGQGLTLNRPAKLGDTVYPKGYLIPKDYEEFAIANGYAKPSKIALIKTEDGESLSVPAEVYFQAWSMDSSNKNQKATKASIDKFNKEFDAYQAEYKERERKILAGKNKKSQGGTQTKTAAKPSTPQKTTGAKPLSEEGQKRASGNASLQKLIQQNQK